MTSVKTRRILLLTTAYKPLLGGSEIAIEQVVSRLPDIYFHIITPRYSPAHLKFEIQGNAAIYRIGPSGNLSKLLFPVLGFIKALSLTRQYKYDAMHVWQASYAGIAACLLSVFKKKLTFILTLQEGKDLERQPFYIRFFRRIIIRRADVITAISSYLADYARSISKKARVIVIPNGVDIDMFTESYSKDELEGAFKRYGIKRGSTVFITVSRLVYKNGIDDILRALAELPSNYILLILGAGPERSNLKELARKLGVEDRVRFFGSMPHKAIPPYLKISDIFIRPSRSEGLGNAFLEAMASGVPVIGTSVGGIKDFLKDGETGIECKANNPKTIVEAVKRLEHKELRTKIVNNAKKLVEDKYNWDKIAKRYYEVLISI